jgi:HD-like signal output (HDOD) protein/CheY-like chemotaxis protein
VNVIYFVDDEQSVLDGLRRMLRDLRKEWRMEFFTCARKALAAMQNVPPDVVVSDMRMPGMDGVELLAQVQKRYPSGIRMVLSGHAEFDAISRVMSSAHQVMSKPCEAEHLRAVLKNAGILCRQLVDPSLAKAIAGLGSLPSIPTVLQELIDTLQRSEVDQRVVAAMIERDPALSVRVLQVANSGFFASRTRIDSISQAVVMLGAEMLKNLVIQVKIVEAFPSTNSSFSLEQFSGRLALITKLARAIAPPHVRVDDVRNLAMTADVGQMVLAARLPDRYEAVLQECQLRQRSIVAIEEELLGANHASVGAYLMGLWGMDPAIVTQIGQHHTPLGSGENEPLLVAVHMAECLVDSDGNEERLHELLQPGLLDAFERRDDVPGWLEQVAAALVR